MEGLVNKIRRIYSRIVSKYHKRRHGSCVVLLYHRVTDIATDPQLLCVKPVNFDKHLKLLSEKYRLLTVDEFKHHLTNKIKFPDKAVLITFDDGYADNYLEALPLLEKYNSQALFYIATGTLNTTNEYWWDAVERIVLLSEKNPVQDTFKIRNKIHSLKGLTQGSKKNLYESLLDDLRVLNSSDRDKKIDELAVLFSNTEPRKSHRAMTFEELRKMNNSKSVVLGAHTHLHPSLGALSYDEQFKEIGVSKKILEEVLSEKVTHFSYPFGTLNDFNEDTLNIVEKMNFEMVAANCPGSVHCRSNRLQFPRFLVRDWNEPRFEYELRKFFN